MNQFSIRKAVPADAQAIGAIARAAYSRYLDRMPIPPKPMLEDYTGLIARGVAHALEAGGKIAGFIILIPGDGGLLLDSLGVAPEFQGMGLGGRLLEFAEDVARELGYGQLILYTNEAMIENLAWYPRRGYLPERHVEENGYRRVYFRKRLKP